MLYLQWPVNQPSHLNSWCFGRIMKMQDRPAKNEAQMWTVTYNLVKKVKADVALHGNPISELWDVTCHVESHSVSQNTEHSYAPCLTLWTPDWDWNTCWTCPLTKRNDGTRLPYVCFTRIGLRSKVPYLLVLRSKWDLETVVWRLFYYITLWCVCLSVLVIITISFIGVAVCLFIVFVGIACLRRYRSQLVLFYCSY